MSTTDGINEPKDYSDGRTKQAFKDSTDINKLLARAAKGETISHLAKHGAMYGDFTDIDDLLTGMTRLQKGQAIFADLPGEIRREFNQDAGAFFNYVNNPENSERLSELLPGLAERGTQLVDTRKPENIDNDPIVKAAPPEAAPEPAPAAPPPPEA